MGKSMVEPDLVETADSIIKKATKNGIKFYLPVDAVVADRMDSKANIKIVPIQEIPNDWMVLDIGPATVLLYSEALFVVSLIPMHFRLSGEGIQTLLSIKVAKPKG